MKKILATVLSVILVATLAFSGTIAYLTDDESAINVFTVGKVNIDLIEQERKEDEKGKGSYTLTDFVNDGNMLPITDDNKYSNKMGLNADSNYMDKIVRVANNGESPAWVRIFVAVPEALEEQFTIATANGTVTATPLHWDTGIDFNEAGATVNEGTQSAKLTDKLLEDYKVFFDTTPADSKDGWVKLDDTTDIAVLDQSGNVVKDSLDKDVTVPYNVYCITSAVPLQPGETTPAAMVGLYLDSLVNYDDNDDGAYPYFMGLVNGEDTQIDYNLDFGVHVPVYVQSIQSEGFATAEAAFKASGMSENPFAFNSTTTNKAATAGTLEELEKAVAKDGVEVVYLTNSISSEIFAEVALPDGVTLDGQNYSLKNIQIISNNDGGDIAINNVGFIGDNAFNKKTFILGFSKHELGNLTVKNCTFEGTYYNAIQYDHSKSEATGKTVTIVGNIFEEGSGSCPLRFRNTDTANALGLVIQNNLFKDADKYTNIAKADSKSSTYDARLDTSFSGNGCKYADGSEMDAATANGKLLGLSDLF